MAAFHFIDSNRILDRIDHDGFKSFAAINELETALDKFGIEEAFVFFSFAECNNPESINKILLKYKRQ